MRHIRFVAGCVASAMVWAAGGMTAYAAGASGGAPGPERGGFDAQAFFEKARRAVVMLRPVNARGRGTMKGTGFLIGSNGVLVTARHVTAPGEAMFAITADNRKIPVAGYLGEDADHDVVVVQLDGNGLAHLPLGPRELPEPGQWVGLVGNPGGGGLSFPTGQVVRVAGVAGVWEEIYTTIPVRRGHSGSPLLNARGEAIGLAVASTDRQRGVAMPASVIHRILERAAAREPTPYEKRPRPRRAEPIAMDPDMKVAREAMQRGDWEKAETALARVLRRFPESPAALFFLGTTHLRRESWAAAAAAFERALQLRGECAVLRFFHGGSLVRCGRTAEGVAALKEALRMGLADRMQIVAARTVLALEAARSRQPEEARAALEELRRVDADRARAVQPEMRRLCPGL
ncbi:MAG: trypsin-like peptidase domain-containing protein [Verrucomicrobia bacterium]|nr:trypsin-like peptidase domain-containing protein [Verrucomicrobiota bacterium]